MTNEVEQNIYQKIKPLVERDSLTDEWLLNRLENLLPFLMDEHNVDMWITVGREYNEDPIGVTFFPSAIDSSRRITIFVFVKEIHAKKVNRFVISTNKQFEPFYSCYPINNGEVPFEVLRRIMDTYRPKSIALNYSDHFSFCDGLSHSFYKELVHSIGVYHSENLISAEPLALDWLQIRTMPEIEAYKNLGAITNEIVDQIFSSEVITPHLTTTEDVVRWIRQKVMDLGLKTSFYPTVDIQRKNASADRIGDLIKPGDVIHLDFGIEYLGLSTDVQQLAYVLQPDEKDAPLGLKEALKTANEFEEIFFKTCRNGMSGNEFFREVMEKAAAKSITSMLYSHPLGYHCHGAGPIIGLYDKQEEIPVKGDLLIQNNTCYAMEFNIRYYIPEWNKDIPIYLEETVCFINGKMEYLTKQQTHFYLIPSN
jgi:Xaa-Pro aminopeptidase